MQFGVNKAAKMSPTRTETGKGGENICEKSKVVVSRKRPKPEERDLEVISYRPVWFLRKHTKTTTKCSCL